MALLRELGFLPLNSRDDFDVLYKFFSRQEFTDDYLEEELELTQIFLDPPQGEAVLSRSYCSISFSKSLFSITTSFSLREHSQIR